MAKILKNIFNIGTDEVKQNFTIESWHVSQSVDALTGTQDYDITISGSLTVTGPTNINGVLTVTQGITGSLFGTASWALNAINASSSLNATSASYALSSTNASNSSNATSASYSSNATSASYALSASYAANASAGTLQQVTEQGAITNIPITASIISASSFTGSLFGTASWALSASYASNASGNNNGNMAFSTSSAFTTQSRGTFFFTGSGDYKIGSIVGADPTVNGEISLNAADKTLVTEIKIPTIGNSGDNYSSFINGTSIVKGSKILIDDDRGSGWYTVTSYAGGSFGTPAFHTYNVQYVSHSVYDTWTTSGGLFFSFYISNPLNVSLNTGYNRITFSGSQNLPSYEDEFGAYLSIRLFPNINNKPGDITILEYNNSSSPNVKLDLQYANRSGSESQSNFAYTFDSQPTKIYIPESSSFIPPLLVSSSEKGTISFMTIQYASGSSSQLGFMKLGFENVKLT
jgi:hypothetical protein